MFLLCFHRACTYPDKFIFIQFTGEKSIQFGLPRLQMQQVVGRVLPLFFPWFVDILTRWHFLRQRLEIEATVTFLRHRSLLRRLMIVKGIMRGQTTSQRQVTCPITRKYISRETTVQESLFRCSVLCYFEKYR